MLENMKKLEIWAHFTQSTYLMVHHVAGSHLRGFEVNVSTPILAVKKIIYKLGCASKVNQKQVGGTF
jgi:hypothetical protein